MCLPAQAFEARARAQPRPGPRQPPSRQPITMYIEKSRVCLGGSAVRLEFSRGDASEERHMVEGSSPGER